MHIIFTCIENTACPYVNRHVYRGCCRPIPPLTMSHSLQQLRRCSGQCRAPRHTIYVLRGSVSWTWYSCWNHVSVNLQERRIIVDFPSVVQLYAGGQAADLTPVVHCFSVVDSAYARRGLFWTKVYAYILRYYMSYVTYVRKEIVRIFLLPKKQL